MSYSYSICCIFKGTLQPFMLLIYVLFYFYSLLCVSKFLKECKTLGIKIINYKIIIYCYSFIFFVVIISFLMVCAGTRFELIYFALGCFLLQFLQSLVKLIIKIPSKVGCYYLVPTVRPEGLKDICQCSHCTISFQKCLQPVLQRGSLFILLLLS